MTLGEAMLKLGFNTDQNSVKEVENQMRKLKSTATKILGVIGISFSFSAMNALAETYSDINQQIKSATDGLGDQEEIQQLILDAANESKLTYEAMAETITDLIQSDEDLFENLEEATEFATLTAKALQVAGESDSAIASAQNTLNGLIADGSMEATDFSSILKTYPELIERMCDGLGVTQDELYDMCEAGEVTAETLVTAFSNAADDVESDFEELDYSISDAMTNISNQWGLFVEELWEGSGLSNEIGTLLVEAFERLMTLLKRLQPLIERVIRTLVDWLDRALEILDNVIEFCSNIVNKLGGVENAAKLLMVVLGSIYAVMNASKILDFVSKLKDGISKISLKTIVIVALIVAIALIVEDFINFLQGNDSVFGEILDSLGIDSEGVRDTILGVFNGVVEFFEEKLPAIQEMFESVWGRYSLLYLPL